MIPVGDIDIGLLIDVAAVSSAEERGGDFARLELIVGPLVFVWIIAKKGHRSVIAVEDRDAAFEF